MSTPGLNRFRQPEYTGENRCIPCTVANVVIGAVSSLVVGYAFAVTVGRFAWLVGAVVFAGSLTAIWLRGYLVPGTPELTKRSFPDRVLRVFDKEPDLASNPLGLDAEASGTTDGTTTEHRNGAGPTAAAPEDTVASGGDVDRDGDMDTDTDTDARGTDEAESEEEVDTEGLLLSAGIVKPCEMEDDLCLAEEFRDGWHERMQAVRDDSTEREELAHELDLDRDAVEIEEYGEAFVARDDEDQPIGQWASRAALVADIAATRELRNWIDGWEDLALGPRSQLISGLRIFLDRCPVCEDTVSVGTETVESCCRSHEVVAANCEGCDARLLEIKSPGPA